MRLVAVLSVALLLLAVAAGFLGATTLQLSERLDEAQRRIVNLEICQAR